MREKLMNLLFNFGIETNDHICDGCGRRPMGEACAEIADHLIANGVTFKDRNPRFLVVPKPPNEDELMALMYQPIILSRNDVDIIPIVPDRWIPVSEPPKERGCYLISVKHWLDGKPVTREAFWNGADWLSCYWKKGDRVELTPRVTHWQYLPQPPKGE